MDAKHTAGTAILSKGKPLAAYTTLPGHPDPGAVKGRIVTLEFEHCYLIGTYVVNAGVELKVGSSTLGSCGRLTAQIVRCRRLMPRRNGIRTLRRTSGSWTRRSR